MRLRVKTMGVLPFAFRSLSELVLWSILILYILSRSSGLDTMIVTELSSEKAYNYLQTLINSPSCLAYQSRIIREQTNSEGTVTNVEESLITNTGVVDITKLYDFRYQNCLRKAEMWDNSGLAQGDEKMETCGWSFWGALDSHDDCEAGYKCVSNVCVEIGLNVKPSQGRFIAYNLTLEDLVTGETHKAISYEQGSKFVYQPTINYKEYSLSDWANGLYPEYLTCNSDFGGRTVRAETPVIIFYPNASGTAREHVGMLSIEMCIGTYGVPGT